MSARRTATHKAAKPRPRDSRLPSYRSERIVQALPAGLTDADLRKMTAAILEQLKISTTPPSVTILQALQRVHDRALARAGSRAGP